MANPTTNYGFVMPSPTDLVTDLPADFDVFGQAVDTQMLTNANAAIAKTIVDAKGDLIGATAADTPARLAVGTNGQVLTADSTAATGLAWATAGGGLTLLSTTTLTGSSVTISSISGSYKNLRLLIKDVYVSSADDINMRLNADTGSNYTFARIRVNGTTVAGGNSAGGTYIQITTPNVTTNTPIEKGFAIVSLPRYTDTDQQEVTSTSFSYWSSLPTYYSVSGNYNKSAAITSITLLQGTGNFSGGTAYLYGES
jgi:hypothetical protein